MTREEVEALILSFPKVERSTSYGEPSFKIAGKFFTWMRPHLDDSVVVHLDSLDERELLIEMDPATFHFTDHYRGHPIVLARVASVDPAWLRVMLARRWRKAAPTRVSAPIPPFPESRIPGREPDDTLRKSLTGRLHRLLDGLG